MVGRQTCSAATLDTHQERRVSHARNYDHYTKRGPARFLFYFIGYHSPLGFFPRLCPVFARISVPTCLCTCATSPFHCCFCVPRGREVLCFDRIACWANIPSLDINPHSFIPLGSGDWNERVIAHDAYDSSQRACMCAICVCTKWTPHGACCVGVQSRDIWQVVAGRLSSQPAIAKQEDVKRFR